MKKIVTIILLSFIATIAGAQQAAQYSMYMWNIHAFNPAYAGLDNSLSITGVYRNQWVSLPGNPVSRNVTAHMPLYILGGAIGIALENETLGSWSQSTVHLSYAWQRVVGHSGILSVGASAGFLQRQFDGTLARTPEGIFDDQNNYLGHNEQSLPFSIEAGQVPTFSAGAFYQGEHLEVGISATNLLENEISLSSISFVPERSYYFFLGYKTDMGRKLQLNPSVLVKSDIFQTQMDLSLLLRYNENIYAGASFRGYDTNSRDAIALMGGFRVNDKLTIGYSHDLTLSTLSHVSNGTHELLLNYNLGKPIGQGKPPIIIYNPRSL